MVEGVKVDAGRAPLELVHRERPLGDHPSARRSVVAIAAELPDVDAGDGVLNLVVVAAHGLRLDVDPGDAVAREVGQHAEDVLDLRLDHRKDRAVVGVWAVEHEEVGEAGRRNAEVRLGAVSPRVGDPATVATGHVDGRQVLRRREAGGEDDRVERTNAPVGRHDGMLGDPFDGLGDQLEVGLVEGGVVHVRRQRTLAPVRMGRSQLVAYLGILDRVDGGKAHRLPLGELGLVGEGDALVDVGFDLIAKGSYPVHVGAELLELLRSVGVVEFGQHPVGGSLEQIEPGDRLDDLGHQLDGACRTANDGDPFAG